VAKIAYWAFLSYSHTDKKWGDWLHKALEFVYHIPAWSRRVLAISTYGVICVAMNGTVFLD
jgi:hypothetical protein